VKTAPHSPVLKVSQLSASLHQNGSPHPILDQVSINIPSARWVSVVGPNGAGKSTLLQCIAGLLRFQGDVFLWGRHLSDWPRSQLARELSWLGQKQPVASDDQVWNVVMLGRLPHRNWLSAPSEADHQAVEQALRCTQAWEWRHRSIGQLSEGERQRVLLARALAVQARLILMDEPLANLDPPHQADWIDLVRNLVKTGTTVVSVLHEISIALQADEMIILSQGKVFHQGGCGETACHRALETVFDHRLEIKSVDQQWIALTGFRQTG
jgi:iron complex transport system ATP-binding protein